MEIRGEFAQLAVSVAKTSGAIGIKGRIGVLRLQGLGDDGRRDFGGGFASSHHHIDARGADARALGLTGGDLSSRQGGFGARPLLGGAVTTTAPVEAEADQGDGRQGAEGEDQAGANHRVSPA